MSNSQGLELHAVVAYIFILIISVFQDQNLSIVIRMHGHDHESM